MEHAPAIVRLARPPTEADIRELARLLVDAVESGAAVSFLAPLTLARAEEWWRGTLAATPARAVCLAARDGSAIVGTVQLQPAWAPNQPHRAEIAKLLVGRQHRGMGLGTRLMQRIEVEAQEAGFTLSPSMPSAGRPPSGSIGSWDGRPPERFRDSRSTRTAPGCTTR